jgi:hypothetical protein
MSKDSNADLHTAAARADAPPPGQCTREPRDPGDHRDPDDLTEMLQELRVLIPGVQVLTGFLLILPFNQGFHDIALAEKWVYLAAFLCGLISLIFLSAPAAQHRIERPHRDLVRFTQYTTRMTITGLVPLSLALILTTQLIVAHTVGQAIAFIISICVAAVIAAVWWIWPLLHRSRHRALR